MWAYYTPGQLEGWRKVPRIERQTLVTERNLGWVGDTGFDLGGRLIRDKLWFYGGVSLSRTVHDLTTSWNRVAIGPDGDARINPDTGLTLTERIAGTTSSSRARGSGVQAIVKLTYSPARRHTLELLTIFARQASGGGGAFGLNPRTGAPEVGHITGDYTALARKYRDDAADVLLNWNARAGDGRWNFDTLLGWHHQDSSALPVDGSRVGSGTGLAATPMVQYRRSDRLATDSDGDKLLDTPLAPGDPGYREVHAVTDFMPLPASAPSGACDPTPFVFHNPTTMLAEHRTVVCPASGTWFRHGPGLIYERRLDRAQVRHAVSRLARGAGHHVVKFGVDFEYLRYANDRGYTGDRIFRENLDGTEFAEYRQYGFLSAPDQPRVLGSLRSDVAATTIGGFLQDSWSIMDVVTLNVGLRYDVQRLFAGDTLAMVMPNQLSPRAGLIWDPTLAGKAKLFVNYGRLYQSVPLNVVDVASAGEPSIASTHLTARCDPNDRSDETCFADGNRISGGGATDPSQVWRFTSAGREPIDPRLKPQANDEVVAGGEYELLANTRIGVQYTHRRLVRMIEDMSRDEGNTYFIGNPGSGIAADFRARGVCTTPRPSSSTGASQGTGRSPAVTRCRGCAATSPACSARRTASSRRT
ncbi:TonB-dependent receptor domain-containing protein [Nannocystis pusilla]|uniref:TonB-dependent receptor domain-containing protein n=1 Tax=Nannocystis pusilla TaxID=889268 RepID=UPI003B79FF7F